MTIKILTIGYLMDFAAHIRPEDSEEIEIGEGKPFKDIPLITLIKTGGLCLVDSETDQVYAIGGVHHNNIVWMLCTTRVEHNKIKFLRYTKGLLKEVLKGVPYLYNSVYKKNILHVKWLQWMGAKFFKETETSTHIAFMFEGRKEPINV